MPISIDITVRVRLPWRARLLMRIGRMLLHLGVRCIGRAIDSVEVRPMVPRRDHRKEEGHPPAPAVGPCAQAFAEHDTVVRAAADAAHATPPPQVSQPQSDRA